MALSISMWYLHPLERLLHQAHGPNTRVGGIGHYGPVRDTCTVIGPMGREMGALVKSQFFFDINSQVACLYQYLGLGQLQSVRFPASSA